MLVALTLVAAAVFFIVRSVLDARRQVAHLEAEAAAPTRDLAAAVQELRRVADHLAPAPAPIGERITVVTKKPSERSFTGILADEWPDSIRLIDAAILTAEGEQPVPGGVVSILKANEAFRQEHRASTTGEG